MCPSLECVIKRYLDRCEFVAAGIKALPSIINACLLTSAWSAASSDLYTSSRALYGLALNGQAPAFLKKTNSYGLPYYCIAVGVAFSLLSYMSAGSKSAGTVFNYFANVSADVSCFLCPPGRVPKLDASSSEAVPDPVYSALR